MRKVFLYIILIVFIYFCIPIFFTNSFNEKTAETGSVKTTEEIKETTNNQIQDTQKEEENDNYNYGKYETIKLLHTKTDKVEEVNIDEYLLNVVSAEMPATYDIEALKAQAVVARTYTIYKIKNGGKHEEADICDASTCCQAWISKEDRLEKWEEDVREENWAKIEEAVNSTRGEIITYDGKPINAFFHASSGGITEMPIDVWGGTGYPYLQVVETSGEEGYSQYSSEVEFSKEELLEKLKSEYSDIKIDFEDEEAIKITEYTNSNRVKTIKFGNKNLSGVETRTLLGLKSANFTVEQSDGKIKFSVIGYGHGVGMSQTGADALAKQGNDYNQIIKHFYIGVEIVKINE